MEEICISACTKEILGKSVLETFITVRLFELTIYLSTRLTLILNCNIHFIKEIKFLLRQASYYVHSSITKKFKF